MLRQLRTEARLTQEELAEQAGLSPRSVSDLERGINRTARKDSAARTSAPEKASEIHREALAKAIELGAPAEEARALAGLGRSQLAGDSAEAARNLREALAIYQRIGTPQARLVQDTLDEHGL